MNKDLHNIALTAFFIPYALLEIPCNVILKLTRPSIWMPSIMLAWGIVMTLTGIVKDFKGLVICRVFLGITEVDAPVPNATCSQLADNQVYTSLASFQAQHTFLPFGIDGMRCRLEWSSSTPQCLSPALSPGSLPTPSSTWRASPTWEGGHGSTPELSAVWWIFLIIHRIFILEGLATIVIAICMYIFLPDGPATAKFLTQEEKRFIITRLETETGSGEGRTTNSDKLTVRQVMEALKEWRIYVAVVSAVASPAHRRVPVLVALTPNLLGDLLGQHGRSLCVRLPTLWERGHD